MSQRWRHHLRRLRFGLGGLLATLLLTVAVLMALGQLLLPLAAHYPERVAAMLSARLQRPVSFASMEGHWQPSGPLLVLHQVRIGTSDSAHALELPTAQVKLDFGALLWPSRHWVNLRLSGLKLELLRDRKGAWHVAGFGSAKPGAHNITLHDLPGNLLLGDLQLRMHDERSGRQYKLRVDPLRLSNNGENVRFAGLLYRTPQGAAVRVGGSFSADGRDGHLYAGGTDMDLGAWARDIDAGAYVLHSGRGSFAIWLDWRARQPTGVTARLDLVDVLAQGPGGEVAVPTWQGLLQYRREGDTLTALYAGPGHAAARVAVSGQGKQTEVTAALRDVDLADLAPLASLLPRVPAAAARWLVQAQPHGVVKHAELDWRREGGIKTLNAAIRGVGFASTGRWPGLDHLDASVLGDAQAVAVTIPAQAVTLGLPQTFGQPFALSTLSGTVVAWHDDAGWNIGTDALDFVAERFGGQLRGHASVPDAGGAPFVDAYARLQPGDVTAAKLFWPDSMPASTRRWLNRAIVSGRLSQGDVVVRGNLADWPFRKHTGRFEGRAVLDDLTLDYDPKWPRATGIHVIANFVDNGMLVEATGARSMGVQVRKAVATIADFHEPKLRLSAQGVGKGASLFKLVRASPIVANQREALSQLSIAGTTEFGFNLDLPLTAIADFALDGSVELDDVAVDNADWGLHLAHLRGILPFDKGGFAGSSLRGVFHGSPSTLSIAVGGATGDPAVNLQAALSGRFSLAQLVEGRPGLASLADLGTGQADFDIGYIMAQSPAPGSGAATGASTGAVGAALPGSDVANRPRQLLRIDSDLRGIALKLPVPLEKKAVDALPMHLQLGLPAPGQALQLSLGDVLRARMRIPAQDSQAWAANVVLGAGAAPSTPGAGIRVSGHSRRLDVSGWVQRALGMSGSGAGSLEQVAVSTEDAEVFGTHFPQLNLQLQPGKDQLELKVDSAQMHGTVALPRQDLASRGVVARFDRLYWPDQSTPPADKEVTPSTAVMPPPSPAEAARTGVNPAQLPPLHLWVGDLRLGKARLGEARFESWPTPTGMHIDQLRTQSKSVHVSATGQWAGNADASHTRMAIEFSAKNLGQMLDALGFEGLFDGGETRAHLEASWPGAPSSLALANMDGTLTVDVGKGRIPEVAPGVGRLFGLMSIAELPRRLTLDFGDVFGKGFGFDSITGHFRLADGNARTDDLTIKGSSAEITIKGRTGLRAHDYDQQVLVVPHVGNSLPLVGAVVGGPIGAAAGLAVQGLLGKGLNKAASARYHIGGSWDKPVITLLEKHNPPPLRVLPSAPASSSSATPAPAMSVPVPPAPATALPASTRH